MDLKILTTRDFSIPYIIIRKDSILQSRMDQEKRAYLELHIAVFLFGFTAILGDLISLPATTLVWWRVLLTCISFFFLIPVVKNIRKIPKRLIGIYCGVGVLVAIHWITFFGAIKFSNASICLVCMATTSFFTSILEPIILKNKIQKYQLLLGVMIIPGMVLVVSNLQADMWYGVVLGLISAFLASLFSSINKKYVNDADPMDITFLELAAAWVFISLILPFMNPGVDSFLPQGMDWFYLLILSLLCTTLAYVLSLRALKHLSAFASNLTVNLEPIYGIILAALLLGDSKELNLGFYLGCGIILLAVFSFPYLKKRFEKKI